VADGAIELIDWNDTPYEYQLNAGEWTTETAALASLPGGDYTLRLRPQFTTTPEACTQAIDFVLTSPDLPDFAVATVDPTDCGVADGRLLITPSEAIALEYRIDAGAWVSGEAITTLGAGIYALEVRPQGATEGCIVNLGTYQLTEPAPPQLSTVGVTPTDCSTPNGSLTIEAAGADLEYRLAGTGDWSIQPVFDNLESGDWLVEVRSAQAVHCISDSLVTVTTYPRPVATLTGVTASDCSEPTGSLHITTVHPGWLYSLNGDTPVTESSFEQLAPGIHTVRIYRAAAPGCDSLLTVTVPEAERPTDLTSEATAASCDQADGQIAATAAGPSLRFQLADGPPQTEGLFTGLAPGSYRLRVYNATAPGCAVEDSLTVPGLRSPAFGAIQLEPSDCASATGRIQVAGTAPELEYRLDSTGMWSTTTSFDQLAVGTHVLQVRHPDQPTCVRDTILTLPATGAGDTLELAIDVQGAVPCLAIPGAIRIDVTGEPDGDYVYNLDGNTEWQTSATFSGLAPGEHQVIASRSDFCVSSGIQTIYVPEDSEQLSFSVSATDPVSCSTSDGTLAIALAYELPPGLEYSIDGGQQWSAEASFAELASGQYTLSVRQTEGGCTLPLDTVTLRAPGAPLLTALTQAGAETCELGNGTLVVEAVGDTLEYSLGSSTGWQTTGVFSGLAAGSYRAAVRSPLDTSCQSIWYDSIALTRTLIAPSATLEATPRAGCTPDAAAGRIEILASADTFPLQYRLNEADWQEAAQFEQLPAGTYVPQLRIGTSALCTTTLPPVNITAGGSPQYIVTDQTPPADCFSSDGSFGIAITGGEAGLEFSLDNGATWQTEPVFTELGEGTYVLALRDTYHGCIYYDEQLFRYKAAEGPSIVEVAVADADACGSANGRIVLTLSNTTPATEVSYDGGMNWTAQTDTSGLAAGSYRIQARNATTGCIFTWLPPVAVGSTGAFAPLNDLSWTVDTTDCNGEGGALFLASDQPYLYALGQPSDWRNASDWLGLAAGRYELYVATSDTSCRTTDPIYVTIPRPPVVGVDSIRATPLSTCGANDGAIQLFPPAPSDWREFALLPGGAFQTTPRFSGLAAGQYTLLARHRVSGCVSTLDTIDIAAERPLAIYLDTVLTPSCYQATDGAILLSAAGGDGNYQFRWADGATDSDRSGLAAGQYRLTVTDGGTCRDSLDVVIAERPDFAAVATTIGDTTSCGAVALQYDFRAYPDLSFEWAGPDGWVAFDPWVTIDRAGTYSVRVESEPGCSYESSFDVAFGDSAFRSDFLLPVEGVVEETVVAIDISWPVPASIEWLFDTARIEDLGRYENRQMLRFPAPGDYTIGLRTHFGACRGEQYRTIRIVESRDSLQTPPVTGAAGEILGLYITPNPNNGQFAAELHLGQAREATFFLYGVNGQFVEQRTVQGRDHYVESFRMENWPAGTYALIAQTANAYAYVTFLKL
jgi:hypothetical protein